MCLCILQKSILLYELIRNELKERCIHSIHPISIYYENVIAAEVPEIWTENACRECGMRADAQPCAKNKTILQIPTIFGIIIGVWREKKLVDKV